MPCKQCGFEQDWEKKLVRVNVVTQAPPIEVNESAICTNDGSDENKTLLVLQQEDENISLIKSWVLNGKKPLFKEIGECNYAVKSLWSQYETLKVDNGLLCKEQSTGGKLRVIVPMKERRVVLQQCHDNKTSGHLGIRKTLGRLKYRFYWPGMRRDVVAYITGCETCVRRKGPQKRKRAPMQIQRSGFPMERIAVDILGELPKTANNNKYILVIADYYTKWTESFPMENMEASTVANIIVTEIICRFGVPTLIHSDQGRQFESELFSEMCNLLQISKTRTTPYHPQSDGMVERFNSTLVKMLSAYVDEHHTNWDQLLPYVMMAYRTAVHETTGSTPNRMMMGREVATPVDIMYELPREVKSIPANKWVWELQERMEDAHQFVQNHVNKEMLRQKQYHDKHLSWNKFNKNDKVFVFFPVRKLGQSPKFTSYWRGPFKVLKQYSEVTYLVNCGRKGRPQVIHVDRMRQCKDQRLLGEPLLGERLQGLEPSNQVSEMNDRAQVVDESAPIEFDFENIYETIEQDEHINLPRLRRERKPPTWLNDYVQD
ncbi:unnamed protein product [Mytilus edulis]|uniref:Integrase catalytic domain-containing protein n=1 Tax=Mytilus edulis TaxID=6550 RepID=A0A8S3UUB7_MYTED|nr:unnamed protein product [Mytilus edulis]